MTILLEKTNIYYLPHCQICDADPYKCQKCNKMFNVNQNDDMYDGDVYCIRYSSARRNKKNDRNSAHVCSIKCGEKLLQERKEKGISRSVKYEKTHILSKED